MSCELFCEDRHRFHARCVGLTYDEGCACLHSNITWMCDSCKHTIDYGRFRRPQPELQANELAMKSDVSYLKTEVERISKIVSQLAPIASLSTTSDEHVSHPNTTNTSASTFSPLSSTKITDQRNAVNDSEVQLFISNIANDVTENDIRTMVCETIGAERVLEVKCLISPGKDLSAYDYISFKVVVDEKHRYSALNTSVWPTGVRCREFRDRRKPVWRPSGRTSSIQTTA